MAVAALTGAEHKPLLGMDNVVPDNDLILRVDLSDPYLYCSLLSRVSPMSSVTVTPCNGFFSFKFYFKILIEVLRCFCFCECYKLITLLYYFPCRTAE